KRMAEQVNPIPNGVYDRSHVLKLALHCVGESIAALTASTPVNGIHTKVGLERRKNRFPAHMRGACAMYQHERRSCARALVSDGRTVFRYDFFHDVVLPKKASRKGKVWRWRNRP